MPPVSSLGHEDYVTEADRKILTDFFHVLNSDWQLKESDDKIGFKVSHCLYPKRHACCRDSTHQQGCLSRQASKPPCISCIRKHFNQVYYQYTEDNPIVLIKGEVEVPASVPVVLDFLHSQGETFAKHMRIMDKMCTEALVVEVFDPKHKVIPAEAFVNAFDINQTSA